MTDQALTGGDLGGRLAEVERQRLRRENQRLLRQIDDLSGELERVRQLQRLEGQLLQREQLLRRDILRELRRLVSPADTATEQPTSSTRPDDEIPAFLRRDAGESTESQHELGRRPLVSWLERQARRLQAP